MTVGKHLVYTVLLKEGNDVLIDKLYTDFDNLAPDILNELWKRFDFYNIELDWMEEWDESKDYELKGISNDYYNLIVTRQVVNGGLLP